MAAKFRSLIASRIRTQNQSLRSAAQNLKLVQVNNSNDDKARKSFGLCLGNANSDNNIIRDFPTDDGFVTGVWRSAKDKITFNLSTEAFVKETLRPRKADYKWKRNALFPDEDQLGPVVVEFSSPNMAKPFHVGHLRSTILGGFIANVYEKVGHEVIRVNWLGDWGTQFCLLSVGIEDSASTNLDDLGIDDLQRIYVEANSKEANWNRALEKFTLLENGDEKMTSMWKVIRDLTIRELEVTYRRLGIAFDHYHGESMYGHEQSQRFIESLRRENLLERLEDGREGVTIEWDNNGDKFVTLAKSDGSSLYLTRDCLACFDRRETFAFGRMIYVVENGQRDHFRSLFSVLQKIGFDSCSSMSHISFGRVTGMSSRKGNAVLLRDILDEAQDRMKEQQKQSKNTKDYSEHVSDRLATTSIMINDMKGRRTKPYDFSWDRALFSKGDSGVKLHYTHCRLCGVIKNNNNLTLDDIGDNLAARLNETEALDLIFQIAKFEEALRDSYVELEPCHLIVYLFKLCNSASKAYKKLPVKDVDDENLRTARLALFRAAKSALAEGMRVLGVEPLEEM